MKKLSIITILIFLLLINTKIRASVLPTSGDIVINEYVTDPQQDWSGSNFTNRHPGSGTLGASDEWIELKNISSKTLDLTGCYIIMKDSTPATNYIGVDEDSLKASMGTNTSIYNATINMVHPGEYIIVCNPSGSLNNDVNLYLCNNTGETLDKVEGLDGNANDINDETVGRIGDGTGIFTVGLKATFASNNPAAGVTPISGDIVINEYVTDPQQDWSGSNFTNRHPGSGTLGASDEWIELKNISSKTLDLRGSYIIMKDSTPATNYIGVDESSLKASMGDNIYDPIIYFISPGEFILIGNPSGSLNNDVNLYLCNNTGETLDKVEGLDGNANDINDEAVGRIPDGTGNFVVGLPATFISNNCKPATVLFTKHDASSTSVTQGQQNIGVVGFHLTPSTNNVILRRLLIKNAGTLTPAEIFRVRLYYDNNNNVIYDNNDSFICELNYNGISGWTNNYINASIGISNSGTNFLITIDVTSNASDDSYFRAYFDTNSIFATNISNNDTFSLPQNPETNANNITVETETPPDIIISEVCDTSPAGASFVEIYNNDTTPVSLSNWQLRFFNNATNSSSPTATKNLSGTLNPGEFIVLANDSGDFQTKYGFAPNFSHGNFFIIDDSDAIDLYDGTRRVDQFGPIPSQSGNPQKDRDYERKNLPNNGTDFNNHWIMSSSQVDGTPKFYNNNGDIVAPYEVIRFIKFNTETAFVVQEQTNIPVIAFKVVDNSNGCALQKLKVMNASNMSYSDISRMKLYYDGDANKLLTAGSNDTYICDLNWNGSDGWTNNNINASIGSANIGTNFLVAIDIAPLAVDGRTFIAVLDANSLYFTNQTTRTGFLKPDSSLTNYKYVKIGEITRQVVINEISWMGTLGNSSHEWIELYNTTPNTISLAGWKLQVGTSEYDLNNTIPAYGFFLIERNDAAITNITADQTLSFSLSDSGKTLKLFDSNGNPVDIVDCANGWFAGDKNGRKTMERITPINDGNDSANWATYSGSGDSFAVDVSNNAIMGTPKETNQNYVAPPDVLSIKRYNVVPVNFYRTNKNVLVYAFKASDTYNHNYTITKFVNDSSNPLLDIDITNISVYKDTNNNYLYDPGEPIIEKLSYNSSGYWYGTSDLSVGSNYLITISVSTSAIFGKTFKGKIAMAKCAGGATASSYANVYEQRLISRPPTSGNFSISPTTVSNQYKENFTISAYVTNKGDGIGKVIAVFSNYETEYTNYTLTNVGGSGNLYELVNAKLPANISPTNHILILRTYDCQNYDYLSNTTPMTVEGNWPPQILSFSVSPDSVYAVGLFDVKFTLIVNDIDGTNKYAVLNLTNIGGGETNYMTNVSNYTQWEFTYTIPRNLMSGVKSIPVKAIDNSMGYTIKYVNLTINSHTIPSANAGDDKTVKGKEIVSISGTGVANDGASISGYNWSVVSNNTGEQINLIDDTKAKVSFIAPNVKGKIVLSLIVKDSWNYESNPDTVTIYINKSFRKDLSDAHPYNTVITPDKDKATFVNLSKGTVITIYTVTGNKVAEIEATSDTADWEIPSYLAAGVYIVYMKDESGDIKKSKIVVIR